MSVGRNCVHSSPSHTRTLFARAHTPHSPANLCGNAPRLGLLGKMRQQVHKNNGISSFSATTETFLHLSTGALPWRRCCETPKWQVLSERPAAQSQTVTLLSLLLLRHWSLSLFYPESSTVPPRAREKAILQIYVCLFFLSLSIRTHESFYPQFAAFCFHPAGFFRVGTLLRLWEPTGAMRLPPLNTCHPPLLRTDLGEREWGLLVRLIRAAPAHLLFYERKLILTLVWNYFFTALASPLISPVIYPKLKN